MRARWFPRPSQSGALPGTQRAALLASHAGRRRNPIYRALLCAIAEAQQRVLVTVAYFVPPRRLRRALMDAARRGVDVRLIVPAFTDAWPTLAAGRRHYGRLLAAGVRVVEHDKALLHAKTVVIDGVWSTVGSFNLDWRSIVHNAEANLLVLDAGMGTDLEALFAKDEERSHPLTLARWQQRGWLARLQEWLAARFQYLL
jgi:cardiolipin synthase